MERPLKERLVGAAVLVLLVVLVLPEMLAGRRDGTVLEAEREEGAAPLRAHEFVMGDAPSAEEQAVEADVLQPDPQPAVPPASLPADAAMPDLPAAAAPAAGAVAPRSPPQSPTPGPPPSQTPNPKPAPVAAPATATPVKPAPANAVPANPAPVKPAPANAAPPPKRAATPPAAVKPPAVVPQHLGAWVIQIGSFGTQQKAEQLVQDLRGRGFRAFTLPYTANGRTLHRVRVGPEQNRKAADDIARRLADLGYTPHVAPQE